MKILALSKWVNIAFLSLGMLSGCLSPSDVLMEESSETSSLLFVKQPHQGTINRPDKSNANEFVPGTDIYLMTPISAKGKLENLTAAFTRGQETNKDKWGAAMDPEVSPDGKKMIFSMRERNIRGYGWHIYEIDLTTRELSQLTVQGDDMDPTYLPDGRILFTSTRLGFVDEYERRPSPVLFVGTPDPISRRLTGIEQLSFNQSHDLNPIVHSSGKIYFCRWEHLGNPNKMPIFTVNPDGSGLFVLYGAHAQFGGQAFVDIREMRDGGILASVMERGSEFEGGAVAIIDISESEDNLKYISEPYQRDGQMSMIFRTPFPFIDQGKEKILVSAAPNLEESGNQRDFGLYTLNKSGGEPVLLYNDPESGEFDPIVFGSGQTMDLPLVLQADTNITAGKSRGDTTGTFFTANVYDRSPNDGQYRPDSASYEARYVRVIEAVPLPGDGNMRGAEIGNTNFEKQKVIGYGNIASDGSFAIDVPADKSMHLQVLNSKGLMLVNQLTWVQVMPGEKRICTGCHASHDRDILIRDIKRNPETGRVTNSSSLQEYISGFNNPQKSWEQSFLRNDTVDFYDKFHPKDNSTIQAVLNLHCISCHGAGLAEGNLNFEISSADTSAQGDTLKQGSSVYERLTNDSAYFDGERFGPLVNDRGARLSPLIWALFNERLDGDDSGYKSLSYDHRVLWEKDSTGAINPFLAGNEDLLKLIEWIDLGTQYANTVGY